MAPPNRPTPRTLNVVSKHYVSPNMLRVTLGGEALDGFPAGKDGGYIKLNLPNADKPGKMLVRTYTIRAQRLGELDVDFALHSNHGAGMAGPATEWALAAKPGDAISIGGPGPAKPLANAAEYYLIAGDMAALPAISVNLSNLHDQACGLAVLEVMHRDDRQELDAPAGIEIRWIVNPNPGSQPENLVRELRDHKWPERPIYAWVASEFGAMKEMRSFLKDEKGLGPDQLYISSYWKSGLDEEAHKVAKREDTQGE